MATKDEPMSLPQTHADQKEADQKAEGSPSAPQDSESRGNYTGDNNSGTPQNSATGSPAGSSNK